MNDNERRRGSGWDKVTKGLTFLTGFVKSANEQGTESYESCEDLTPIEDKFQAEIVSSRHGETFRLNGKELEVHKIAVDIDFPVHAVETSTPGHFHLYIDYNLDWKQYEKLLKVMAEVGLVEPGYVEASRRRRCTHLRVPWLQKPEKKQAAF